MPVNGISSARERIALENGTPTRVKRVRDSIRASWARCEQRRLAIEDLSVPFSDALDLQSRLVSCATPVLKVLQSSLSGEPISILLCDDSGLVLTRACDDRDIVHSLDKVALAPGSNYSEAAVGTNGFGLALVDDRPSLVAGYEHYCTKLADYNCAGAPIHDPVSGRILGALSLTTWSDARNDLLLALAEQTAMNIEAQVAVQSPANSVTELHGYLSAIALRQPISHGSVGRPGLSRFEVIERDAILDSLERHEGAVTAAAEDLGISRATIYRKIKHYRIQNSRTRTFVHLH